MSRFVSSPYGPVNCFGEEFTARDLELLQNSGPSDPQASLNYENLLDANGNAPGDKGYNPNTSAVSQGTAVTSLATWGQDAAPGNYNVGSSAPVPSSDSTISDVTKGVLGVVSAGGSIANTVLQNQTISSLLASRGIATPRPAPAPSASIPWGPLALVAGIGLAIWKASQ